MHTPRPEGKRERDRGETERGRERDRGEKERGEREGKETERERERERESERDSSKQFPMRRPWALKHASCATFPLRSPMSFVKHQ